MWWYSILFCFYHTRGPPRCSTVSSVTSATVYASHSFMITARGDATTSLFSEAGGFSAPSSRPARCSAPGFTTPSSSASLSPEAPASSSSSFDDETPATIHQSLRPRSCLSASLLRRSAPPLCAYRLPRHWAPLLCACRYFSFLQPTKPGVRRQLLGVLLGRGCRGRR